MWRRDRAARGVFTPNNAARMRQLAQARAAHSWFAEGSSVVQQGALRDFDRAVKGFFEGHKNRPTWRSRERDNGFVVRPDRPPGS